MALTTGTVFEIRATATTANVNGAGFNPANANMLTDLTTDTNTANTSSPVVSSVSYSFVAGDVGAWVYIKSGTNWTPGWYQIASVASNKATLSAAIGAAMTFNNRIWATNTVAGCATVGTPTAGTFTVDYSQQDTAKVNAIADFAAIGASSTLTSTTAGFTPVMVGNFFHQTTTGTGAFGVVGWYEIVSYTNATTVVLDRTPNSGTASVATTGYVGGAGRLNGLEDAFFEMLPAGSWVNIKNGSYTLSAAIAVASTNSTAANPSIVEGYNSLRGDDPRGSTRPTITGAANSITFGQFQIPRNIIFTATADPVVTIGTGGSPRYCKFYNSSSATNRGAFVSASGFRTIGCEIISQNGQATAGAGTTWIGCYIHDSLNGFSGNQNSLTFIDCIFEANSNGAISTGSTGGLNTFIGNTFYGTEAKRGIGINFSAAVPTTLIYNNIFYGLATGILVTTTQQNSNQGGYNTFFNNTADVTLYNKDVTDIALDPQFVGATQITGTAASGSGSVLTDSTANFSSVTDNVDFVRVISGTGATVGNYLITGHTTTTLTCNNAVGTNATTDRVYYVSTGHNFAIGTNLKAAGYPGAFAGSETTGYLDIGAVQRQEAGGGSSGTVGYAWAG